MMRRQSGHIINMASIGGLHVTPTAAVYCATKFAVRAISDGLRQENDRIRVTCVCPGVVESELADSISDPAAREEMRGFRAIPLKPDPSGRAEWRGSRATALTPEASADAVLHAISQPADVDTTEIVVRPVASPH